MSALAIRLLCCDLLRLLPLLAKCTCLAAYCISPCCCCRCGSVVCFAWQATEAEAAETERRIQEQVDAANAAKAQLAAAQLVRIFHTHFTRARTHHTGGCCFV